MGKSSKTTKGGRFVNPADQERRAAKKRELAKNKRDRDAIRKATLEAVDPKELLKEIYATIDQERVAKGDKAALPLQERRRKLKEQFERILSYLEKENPDKLAEFKKWEDTFHRQRTKRRVFYYTGTDADIQYGMRPPPPPPRDGQDGSVADEIPLPSEAPTDTDDMNDIPLPDDDDEEDDKDDNNNGPPAPPGPVPPRINGPPPLPPGIRPPFRPPPPGMHPGAFPPPPPGMRPPFRMPPPQRLPPPPMQIPTQAQGQAQPGIAAAPTQRAPRAPPKPDAAQQAKAALASTMTAEPQVRDKKAELRGMMPTALRVKRSVAVADKAR